MIRIALVVASGVLASAIVGSAQNISDQRLASLLSNAGTRESIIDTLVSSGRVNVPLFLDWTKAPPAKIDKYNLYLALAELFGRLRTRAAIPFLINNIDLQKSPETPNTWMKTAQVIRERMPAIAALIEIGPSASEALIHTPMETMSAEKRLAAIFVVGQIPGVSDAPAFLKSLSGQANLEYFWAQKGLKLLEERH